MKVKCIKDTFFFSKNKLYTVHVDVSDDELVELYITRRNLCDVTIAQVMSRFYLKDSINCWRFDHYFKTHFEIIN